MRNPVRGLGSWSRRQWLGFAVPVALVLILAVVIAFFIDEPLRRMTENEMNRDRSTARGRARGRSWSGWLRTRSSRPSRPASSGRPPSHAASAT